MEYTPLSQSDIAAQYPSIYMSSTKPLEMAREIMDDLWAERCAERGLQPVDRSGSCKFAALLARKLFGGRLAGNKNHVFIISATGFRIDLNFDQGDVKELGEKAYIDDPVALKHIDYRESLGSCMPRVNRWFDEYQRRMDKYGKLEHDILKSNAHPMSMSTRGFIAAIREERNYYKRVKAFGDAFIAGSDPVELSALFKRINTYTGYIPFYLAHASGFDLKNLEHEDGEKLASFLAANVARVINTKTSMPSMLGIYGLPYDLMGFFHPKYVNQYVDSLLDHCIELGEPAISNLLCTNWENYSHHQGLADAMKRSIERKGELVETLTQIVGKKNLSRCYQKLQLPELMPFATSKQKRSTLENALGL